MFSGQLKPNNLKFSVLYHAFYSILYLLEPGAADAFPAQVEAGVAAEDSLPYQVGDGRRRYLSHCHLVGLLAKTFIQELGPDQPGLFLALVG